jgi:ABC-type branched-subunit amino acid transport system substrate-binding protein
VVQDDQTNPTQALADARELDTQDHVVALSGPTSSDSALAVYGYAEQNGIPFVVPTAAFPQLTKPGTHWTFRMEPDAVGWGYAIARFIAKVHPKARIAMLYGDFAVMRAVNAGLQYEAPRAGLSVVSTVLFPQNSSDATVQAAQVKAQNPDMVVVAGTGGFDNTLTTQLLDLGFRPDQLIHPFGTTTQVYGWGPRSTGSYYGTFFDKNLSNLSPAAKDFVKEATASEGRYPAYTEDFCYTSAMLIRDAIARAKSTDRRKIREAIASTNETDRFTGVPVHFDKNGARKEFMYIMQIGSVDGHTDYDAKQVDEVEWSSATLPVYSLLK